MVWNDLKTQQCKELVENLVQNKAHEGNPSGLKLNSEFVTSLFQERGFSVVRVPNPDAPYRPILIATSSSNPNRPTVGFFSHYDVEDAQPSEWGTDPWSLNELNGRWYGRGVADNLVPLAQRILLSDEMSKYCNLVFILQGEEEIGSPYAMKMYPSLDLPPIDMWVEETGYFYKNGNHRIMAVNVNQKLESVIDEIVKLNTSLGMETKVRVRPMNKAFGNQGCPCLVHLLKDVPYIALGPNDDHSTIHGIDESIDPSMLRPSAQHLMKALEVLASGSI
ncbi:M20/M25/M40 family metallo-hydrolase [Candidatus Poseidoniaceae archaeon]|nr:M20/M25/M40 family metallo-hydrolase [Euryarchaeota archaeon]MDC3235976.1 M20/M25/M40 family metallo-hydrolase [Candidatus Poseidoniaceae archaeon]